MILYGLLTSPIVLGAKQDLCATCNVAGPHLIVRRVRWIEIFFIPVLPIWISHRLIGSPTTCYFVEPLPTGDYRLSCKN